MEALIVSSAFPSPFPSSTGCPRAVPAKPIFHLSPIQRNARPFPVIHRSKSNFRVFTAVSPAAPFTQEEEEEEKKDEGFDWYAHWCPVAPLSDLDKRRPHGVTVLGFDLVVWYDRNESAWKVFDDSCPHRLAPLSEGRIDQWGRLQCVYHGWCFGGSGDCKFIPQAPRDGPPVNRKSNLS